MVRTAASPIRASAGLQPPVAELGQRVLYRGWVRAEGPAWGRWLPPDSGAAFTWGAPVVSAAVTWGDPTGKRFERLKRKRLDPTARHNISAGALFVEIPLQAFALGRLSVPGLRIAIDDGRGPRVYRLPVTTLTVVPMLTAADSNADFRAVHGPLAAPWWERVPWTWVILGLFAVSLGVALLVWWRRRRRGSPAASVPIPAARDPLAEALAALAALRALHLPEHGRFAEHAFRLGQILRRYLESVIGTTRPGDTTPELVAHLRQAGLEPEDLTRFSGLLRAWDQVKFAREPFSLDEAIRAERATEAFVRRPAAPTGVVHRVA